MRSKSGKTAWLMPVLLALPGVLGLSFASVRYGGQLLDLIHLAIKLVVKE